ncbi:jg23853, partial [Pararge aegeria aegeria]
MERISIRADDGVVLKFFVSELFSESPTTVLISTAKPQCRILDMGASAITGTYDLKPTPQVDGHVSTLQDVSGVHKGYA